MGNCAVCTATTCSQCMFGYYLSGGSCSTNQCNSNCLSCVWSQSYHCTRCSTGKFLDDQSNNRTGTCVSSCDTANGYYVEIYDVEYKLCGECNTACKTCVNSLSSGCLECSATEANKYLMPQSTSVSYGSCLLNCGAGYTFVANGATFKCVPCHDSCYTCSATDEASCTKCKTTGSLQYLYETSESGLVGRCQADCTASSSKYTYMDGGHKVCRSCDSTCSTC